MNDDRMEIASRLAANHEHAASIGHRTLEYEKNLHFDRVHENASKIEFEPLIDAPIDAPIDGDEAEPWLENMVSQIGSGCERCLEAH